MTIPAARAQATADLKIVIAAVKAEINNTPERGSAPPADGVRRRVLGRDHDEDRGRFHL